MTGCCRRCTGSTTRALPDDDRRVTANLTVAMVHILSVVKCMGSDVWLGSYICQFLLVNLSSTVISVNTVECVKYIGYFLTQLTISASEDRDGL